MIRVTPEEVVAAYRATGMSPWQCSWGHRSDDGQHCGCPMAALACAAGSDGPYSTWANDQYGGDYVDGFTHGVDSPDIPTGFVDGERYAVAHEDGKAAWAAVVAAGL